MEDNLTRCEQEVINKVAVVVVIFYPSVLHLNNLLASLLLQAPRVFVIDNTPGNSSYMNCFHNSPAVRYIRLGDNVGIAAAHNIGIRSARDEEYDYVLLMDQDSFPEANMLNRLVHEKLLAEFNGLKIAAVGPMTIDKKTGAADYFTKCHKFSVELIEPTAISDSIVECDFLISSGCLIPLYVLDQVGLMDESLFIDCVDIEWGFRARNFGYNLLGVTVTKMDHEIGDSKLEFLGRKLTMHSPLRHYYFFRNFYRLLFFGYVPKSWKIHVLIRSSIQAAIFSFVGDEGRTHFRMILKGIFHGLIGKKGKYGG